MGTGFVEKTFTLDGDYAEYCAYLRDEGLDEEEIAILTEDIVVGHLVKT